MRIIRRLPQFPSTQKTSILSKLNNYSPQQTLSLLQSCRSPSDFSQIHAQILRRGQAADPFVATRMLESCAASGDTATAVRIFDGVHRPNVFMWTAVIRGFVAAGAPQKAIHFYTLMRSLHVEPYKFTFLYALKAYSLMGDLHRGRTLHANIIKIRLDFDAYLRSALVNFYSNCRSIEAALHVFEEIPDGNNSVVWNAAIAGCFTNGDVDKARSLFDDMPERDSTAWNTVMSGYSKCGHVDSARALFDMMDVRDLLAWSVMVAGYVQSGRAAEALELFDEMFRCGVRPDAVTMATALSACAQIGALDVGKWIHAYVDKNELRCDVVLGTSLVDMYAKCGCIDLALQVFHGMEHKNVSSWNAMICGLALNGRGNDALAIFRKMESTGVVPNDITFVGVLSACSHIGAVAEGRWQFEHMCGDLKIAPKIEHYGCMVDLFGRAGLVSEAGELIMGMPMVPNPVILGAFLSACMMHGDASASKHFTGEVSRLSAGDGGCHVLLSNIYASKHCWDGVARIRRTMKGMGLRKVPGCSSIEVNGVVHEFVVEDQSHPGWEEIYMMINKLSAHLEIEGNVPNSQLVLYDIDEEFV